MRILSFPVAAGLLLAGCVAFVVTAYGEYRSLGELTRLENVRAHAFTTQVLISRFNHLLVDLETGQRGFLMTGDASFLQPYDHGLRELDPRYGELKLALQRSGDPQDAAIARLDRLIADRRVQLAQNVDSRWKLGEAAIRNVQAWVAGKQLMDEIRGELDRLDALQQQRINDIETEVRDQQEQTTRLAQIFPLVGGALVAAALVALWAERKRRDDAEVALRDSHAQLETVVDQRTQALREALDRIQSFAAELDRSVEGERRRLAREVHDQLGQLGTASKMLVMSLTRKLAPQREPMLEELLGIADDVIGAARRIASTLRPPLLDDFGFSAAVQHYAQGLERQSGLVVSLDLASDEGLDAEQHNQLFRLMQEAATNVLRHAQAQHLAIESRLEGGDYCLRIQDDGVGPGHVRADASGLRNMRERAVLAGGEMRFGPAPGQGTRVEVRVPMKVAVPSSTSAGAASRSGADSSSGAIESEEGWDEVSDR
ncbi:CHASE3 domain-containing protein [Roseateles terrae]|uniref:Signal transduction histidine kinase n=1 Tax=Roseateles terrae TaxID=431060 RepID=A0ABR6GT31_9BURK|nr:CHASE3 domain-containing protein [Roseateles terrae]MBB3195246.1 signal transduction histidine kinase [Roseateles terrae]